MIYILERAGLGTVGLGISGSAVIGLGVARLWSVELTWNS